MTVTPEAVKAAGDKIAMIVADANDRKIGPATAMFKIEIILGDVVTAAVTAERDRIRCLSAEVGAVYSVQMPDGEVDENVPFDTLLTEATP